MMKKTVIALLLGISALSAQVKENIEVPYIPYEVKMGKGFDAVQANCLTCHSFGYVINQGRQSKAFWHEKVVKMVDAFKAPISKEDQVIITDYLYKYYGNGNGKLK